MKHTLGETGEFISNSTIVGDKSTIIEGIEQDSRLIKPGYIFALIKGEHFNGSDYINEAIKNGASSLLTDREQKIEIPQLIIPDVRDTLGEVSAFIYNFPSEKMRTFGITGTNGKSTTAFFTREIFMKNGLHPGMLSSAGFDTGTGEFEYSYMTTPEAPLLQRIMARSYENGCENFVLEISSHGFAFNRVKGTTLEGGVFTNLTRAHLDQHKDMEGYFEDKAKILNLIKKDGFFISNSDDDYSQRLIRRARDMDLNVVTYGLTNKSNIFGEVVTQSLDSLTGKVTYKDEEVIFTIPISGDYNLSNALASIGVALQSGISLENSALSLKNSPTPQGRMEFIDEGQPFTVIVDYAHSPDSFRKVLPMIKKNLPTGGRLILVFGATGSRDIGKRPIMGEIAGRYADISVLTDENPYWEEAEDIISHIADGFENDNYIIIVDRADAMRWAFNEANDEDVVLIVGKGHENYICVKDEKIPFNDCDKSHEILKEMEFGG